MSWNRRATFGVILMGMIASGLAVWRWRHSPVDSPAIPQRAANTAPQAAAPANQAPSPSETEATIAAAEIRELLAKRPGSLIGRDVRDFMDRLKLQPTRSLGAARQLQDSDQVSERVFGFYLELELAGWSEVLARRALADGSPFVPAHVAEWLFLRNEFGTWERFVDRYGATMNADGWNSLMSLLDRNPPFLRVPSAMSFLGLGRGVEPLLSGLMGRYSVAREASWRAVFDEKQTAQRREALLRLLWHADPEVRAARTATLAVDPRADSHVRDAAVRQFVVATGDEFDTAFVGRIAAVVAASDPVRPAVDAVASYARSRAASYRLHVSELAAAVANQIPDAGTEGAANLPNRLREIAELAHSPAMEWVPKDTLRRVGELSARVSPSNYASRTLASNLRYLQWRSLRDSAPTPPPTPP